METNEKKYEKLISDLKSLQQVKAPANFEADLKRRINQEKYKDEEKSFWGKLFLPSRLIPSLGFVTTAAVIFLVVNVNSEEIDNPFLIEPRLREDVIAVTDYDSFEEKTQELNKEQPVGRRDELSDKKMKSSDKTKTTEREMITGREEVSETDLMVEQPPVETEGRVGEVESAPPESTLAELTDEVESAETSSEMATGLAITKEELNFRQVQLSEEEQQVVDELRTKVQSLQNVKKEEDIK
ncbi:MAG: hypothetical protein KJN64_03975 [Ignavibacteria bacterium]|nr:hypothetical protein [Ignavibacteria bacterium]MBT8383255.1 hypothetical protein [Ignavibacteria bacterium]MBT8390360.1 hypothetical protein [Ignavibacteria bacterium]NNJ53380.1 hypothetical protein [Ignavibacteriaceae bacterium]NNL21605.1 hypothetical protein [Ignavibacteriaceae bacterium]